MTTAMHQPLPFKEQQRVLGAVVLVHAIVVGGLWWMSLNNPAPEPKNEAIMLEMPGDGGAAGSAGVASPELAAPAMQTAMAQTSATAPTTPQLVTAPQMASLPAPTTPAIPSPAMASTTAGSSQASSASGNGAAPSSAPAGNSHAATSGSQQGDGRGGSTAGDGGAGWRHRVLAHLERAKRYPELARLMKREGLVQVSFAMNRRGEVLSVAIAKGSGMRALDDEAMDVVRRSQPLPAPPGDVDGERIDVLVPIRFTLQGAR
ncbi:energy transducer TonB [Novosphingobium umbonatum]|uniref:Energy transducer TonB n=1 Tax=Novosphingobium umbonatum TaxID=1908524 RepID=A0A3S2VPF5_9SPHN|nr:energy transducer TonB [Novosphingobium umbonatum]RVU02261.1 energy transducer TonB [Novosphingobium umbonatum]